MSAISEKDYLNNPKSYVDAQTILASGMNAKISAQLLRSPDVRKSYVGFRLFVRRDDALAWLTANAPGTQPPACLEPTARARGPRASKALLPPTAEMKERLVLPPPARMVERTPEVLPPERQEERLEEVREAAAKPLPSRQEPEVKGRGNYSDDQIRGFHTFLQAAKTKEDRAVIYEEIGATGQAVSQWFRRLGLPALGQVVSDSLPKKRGRPASTKETAQPSFNRETPKVAPAAKSKPAQKNSPAGNNSSGLSLEAKETLIRLMHKLLLDS